MKEIKFGKKQGEGLGGKVLMKIQALREEDAVLDEVMTSCYKEITQI